MDQAGVRRLISLIIIGFAVTAVVSKLLPIPFGIFVVPTRSMVPVINPGDLVIVFGKNIKVGDIIVWCTSPLYCVVHRLVEVKDGYLVTKGDANPLPDNPVPATRLKGKVVAIIPRYIWIPLILGALLYIFAPSIVSIAREPEVSPLLIASGIFGFYVVLAAILPLLYTSMSVAMLGYVKTPVLYLAKAYFSPSNCTIDIEYRSMYGLHIIRINHVFIDGKPIDSYVVDDDKLRLFIPPPLLTMHVEESNISEIQVGVDAVLTRMGRLIGIYRVMVPFKPLRIAVVNESVKVINPNCYPIHVNITFLYAYSPGSSWRKISDTVLVGREFVAKLPISAPFVYVDVSYRAYGHVYSSRLRVR